MTGGRHVSPMNVGRRDRRVGFRGDSWHLQHNCQVRSWKHGRSIFGTTKIHCACPTSSKTSSASNAAVAADRFAAHDGHSPRVLHENANRYSSAQSGHRIRAKPFSKRPQSR
jgi:hypothetical protein